MIEHISDTARWVAYYRAMETERPDALFRDPYARHLAGPVGEAIVERVRRGRQMAWAMIVRTAVFDEIILDRVRAHGVDLVVNLACGLDTRPWRLPLPSGLRWVDVDLPGILEAKTSALSGELPACRYEAVPTDLTDPVARDALLSRLAPAGQQALVVTEGLLVYLRPEQVLDLAHALHRPPAFRWWLTDLASPRLLKRLTRSWGSALERGNAPFRFGPAEGTAFFGAAGWREAEFRSTLEEARRVRREMPLMWLWRLLGRLSSAADREAVRRMSGYVLLERDAT